MRENKAFFLELKIWIKNWELKKDDFFGEAVLMMELPKRYSTPSEGGRFAPIKSSDYGGRPLLASTWILVASPQAARGPIATTTALW